jgi:hypothetical protein
MADVFKVRANKTEGFVFISLLQQVDSLDGFFVEDVAADAVNGVGRINDDTAFCQNIHRSLYESALGIEGIYFNQHLFVTVSFYKLKAFKDLSRYRDHA